MTADFDDTRKPIRTEKTKKATAIPKTGTEINNFTSNRNQCRNRHFNVFKNQTGIGTYKIIGITNIIGKKPRESFKREWIKKKQIIKHNKIRLIVCLENMYFKQISFIKNICKS